ncbi:MAG: PolC-type DNA polymerase III [Firmicutes bacterium]|nr:PolC-type DNA polymerase III [Bacillota bacterium]
MASLEPPDIPQDAIRWRAVLQQIHLDEPPWNLLVLQGVRVAPVSGFVGLALSKAEVLTPESYVLLSERVREILQASLVVLHPHPTRFSFDPDALGLWLPIFWQLAIQPWPEGRAEAGSTLFAVEEGEVRLIVPHAAARSWIEAHPQSLRRFLALATAWTSLPNQVRCVVDPAVAQAWRDLQQRAEELAVTQSTAMRNPSAEEAHRVLCGQMSQLPIVSLHEVIEGIPEAAVEGQLFSVTWRDLRAGRKLLEFHVTDETDTVIGKYFPRNPGEEEQLKASLEDGVWVRIEGSLMPDPYLKELSLTATAIALLPPKRRVEALPGRVEWHVHTTMSAMDGLIRPEALAARAKEWGMGGVAICDHGVVQAFPEVYASFAKIGIPVYLGLTAYMVDDEQPILYHGEHPTPVASLQHVPLIAFDTETTGLSADEDALIEISAVKFVDGEAVDTFSTLINPQRPLPVEIVALTHIDEKMLVGQPLVEEVLPKFLAFCEGGVLVAHNAHFDVTFVNHWLKRLGLPPLQQDVVDTLALARFLFPQEKNYRLETLCAKFGIPLESHHRALDDARACGEIALRLLEEAQRRNLDTLQLLDRSIGPDAFAKLHPQEAVLFPVEQAALHSLYQLVSASHLDYLAGGVPRLPKSLIRAGHDGFLVGSVAVRGEIFQSLLDRRSREEILEALRFYDYVEVTTPQWTQAQLPNLSEQQVRELIATLVSLCDQAETPLVAVSDAHVLDPSETFFREVLAGAPHNRQCCPTGPCYLQTTQELLDAFAFLGEHRAYQLVVEEPQALAQRLSAVKPIPDELHAPQIPNAAQEVREEAYRQAHARYGDPLPTMVAARLERELDGIINHGYAVIYLIAQRLVQQSLADGYLVGSRGSVGSSLVATLYGITEVNPLPPHYVCPVCHFTDFIIDGSVGSGFDLPDKACPKCGGPLEKDGHDIAFETFMGFHGEKVPDIDLNFGGEYQPRAHRYTETLFGENHVFRAGTISTIAEKTAYSYARKFADSQQQPMRRAELDRIAIHLTGVKRTTGQHPGGVMIVPTDLDIHDFTPVQYPADDIHAQTKTTHFDYHAISSRLLKLDLLGHDDPSVLRMLQDLTNIDPRTVPPDDDATLSLFYSSDALKLDARWLQSEVGTIGLPEFGTRFVRQMLEETRPHHFAELVRISGLSHGTNVWVNNAQEWIRQGEAQLADVISTRDDVMLTLIRSGVPPEIAFQRMEQVRHGRGLSSQEADELRHYGVPEWFITSCQRIGYLFPKAHAVAYVWMAVRIAYFKVHAPEAFYASYFSVRATDTFDYATIVKGPQAVKKALEHIEHKGNEATSREKESAVVLEVALEMFARGIRLLPIDLYHSAANRFTIEADGSLRPPFLVLPGLGAAAAEALVSARESHPFLSIDDLRERAHLSKSVIDLLRAAGALDGLAETNQVTLF